MLTSDEISAFCSRCNWAHECWQLRKYLFDENPELELLQAPENAHFFQRILEITQEYWIQQVAKLHDPAEQNKHSNLALAYIYERGDWSAPTKARLQVIKERLDKFFALIKDTRNQLLAHNDRDSILDERPMGAFEAGADSQYFSDLQEFANLVHEQAIGGPFPFDGLVPNDVEIFMRTFRIRSGDT